LPRKRCLAGRAAGVAAALAVDGSAPFGALGDGPRASTSLAAVGSLLQVRGGQGWSGVLQGWGTCD